MSTRLVKKQSIKTDVVASEQQPPSSSVLSVNNEEKQTLKIERVVEGPTPGGAIVDPAIPKKELEWVTVLLSDLKRLSDKDFAEFLFSVVTQWLEKSKSKLDPKEFRTLYINKNYSNTDNQTLKLKQSSRQISISMMSSSLGNSSLGLSALHNAIHQTN